MEERLTAAGGELAATVREGVATVTLNRPATHNALTLGMIEGLGATWVLPGHGAPWNGGVADAVRLVRAAA